MAKGKQKSIREQNRRSAARSEPATAFPKRIGSAVGVVVTFIAAIAGIYTVFPPTLVALPDGNQFNGQIRSNPGNGITVWIDGSVIFRNRSIRGGGRVGGLNILSAERDSSAWLPVRVSTVQKEEFSAFEEKRISFSIETKIAQLKPGDKYPPLHLVIRFLDGNGSEIPHEGSDKPYELILSWPSDTLGSLKNISG